MSPKWLNQSLVINSASKCDVVLVLSMTFR